MKKKLENSQTKRLEFFQSSCLNETLNEKISMTGLPSKEGKRKKGLRIIL
ncbi:hypothetical protein Q783_09020 [Carnobacterium inhibens subsp. gilichinskyi]|uniref:Uncharacterized protein n=1 Tax=Carnobacterium inhibens subsp. gilichinskyi TaxID=1266845 RepID=U5SC84_9LACT|nr:hypothetical protein Q783_09020 [Carnobacterium inhibens subsp. gilichinskyi]